VLVASAGSTTIYGPLAAPIAFLVWLFVTSMAVLIGAAFNAAIDFVWPRLELVSAGVPSRRSAAMKEAYSESHQPPIPRTVGTPLHWFIRGRVLLEPPTGITMASQCS